MVEPDGRTRVANLHVARERRGSLVIECVIAAALIATATLALTRLARQTTDLNHQADNRLAAKLVAENFLERTKDNNAEQLEKDATTLAESMAEQYGSQITTTTDRFESGDRRGTHLQIEVVTAPNARVMLHDWRLIATETPRERTDDTEEETTENDVPENDVPENDVPEANADENQNDTPGTAPSDLSDDQNSAEKETDGEPAAGGSDDAAK